MLFLILMVLYAFSLHSQNLPANPDLRWTQEIEVKTDLMKFGGDTYYAYSVKIWNTDDREVRKMWQDEMKDLSEKVKRDVALNAQLPVFPEPVDMHTRREEEKKQDYVTLSAAFLYKEEALNPDDHPEAHREAIDMMHAMAVRMNKAVVEEQIEDQMKELEKRKKDFEKLIKEQEKLEKSIEKDQKRLRKAAKEERKLKRKVRKQEGDIAELMESAGADLTEEELKDVSKERRKLSKLEDQLSDAIDDQSDHRKDIGKAEKDLAENKEERRKLEAEIEQMERRLTTMQRMRLDIQ